MPWRNNYLESATLWKKMKIPQQLGLKRIDWKKFLMEIKNCGNRWISWSKKTRRLCPRQFNRYPSIKSSKRRENTTKQRTRKLNLWFIRWCRLDKTQPMAQILKVRPSHSTQTASTACLNTSFTSCFIKTNQTKCRRTTKSNNPY